MSAPHPIDLATELKRLGPDRLEGRTSEYYSNFGGPFGGSTAATLLRAVLDDERRQGPPVALTVNFCAAIAEGAFEISCRERRTGRSTQHWSLELTQNDRVAATASVVCGQHRPVWSHHPASPPTIAPPETLPELKRPREGGWLDRYEMRFAKGQTDFEPRDPADLRDPVSLLWMRDKPARPLDYLALASMSDAFIIRAFIVRGQFVPVGTVTLTTFFHADEEAMARQGTRPLLCQATARTFSGGFFDQTAELWGAGGRLLATSTQIVWYKE